MCKQYTKVLAKFASELTYDKIPKSIIEHNKLCILDTFACGLFGSTLPWCRIVASFAIDLGERKESVIWGRNFKVSAPNAALVNGTAVHSFELDDLHKISIVHPGGVVTTSALAMAEQVGNCDGEAFLTAVVVGYEIAARVGMSVGTSNLQKGFHPTGTSGTFGAGAAAGKILKLDSDRMTHALGIAGTQAAGLMAAQFSAMVKRVHAGRAAQSGIYGALLAEKGLTGITNILEADFGGYCSAMADESDKSLLIEGLGEDYEAGKVGFKPYAAGGSTHTGHEAVKAIMGKNSLTAEVIDEIVMRVTTATYKHTSWEYTLESITAAQMNMHYVVAVTVLDNELFIDQFTTDKIADPRIIALSKRVKVYPDPTLDMEGPEFRHAVIATIKTTDGRVFTERIDAAKGSNKNPMNREEVVTKYEILSGKVLNKKQIADLYDAVMTLENISDVRELAHLLKKV